MVRLELCGQAQPYDLAPSKIIALGLNYKAHIAELSNLLPGKELSPRSNSIAEPVLFSKTPNVLIGNGQAIRIPAILRSYDFPEPRCDYEAELALVVSRPCKNVSVQDAMGCILGFTCFNDVSQRNIQNADISGWFRGKSFDTFGPIGPRIVPPHLLPEADNLELRCYLNGTLVQRSSTSQMVHGVRQILSFVSHNFSLFPGDVISTGTPSGVGPLRAGDVVEVEIQGIGRLSNPVIAE